MSEFLFEEFSLCFFNCRYRSREDRRLKNLEETDMCESFLAQGNSLKELIDESLSSGSGSGLPLLVCVLFALFSVSVDFVGFKILLWRSGV